MIKVIIADDHTIVRHGLVQILNSDPGIEVVGEAASGDEVLRMLRSIRADVVVLDITMPGRNGLETLKEIREMEPNLPVLILSMHPSDQYALRVLRAGASGYLTKETAPGELVHAIKHSFRGQKYLSPEVAELLAGYIQAGYEDEPHKRLSDREFEVFVSIGAGKSVSEIAEELYLSVKTVSTYRSRILEKTGLANNAEITRYCLENRLI
ncbi:MAG: response regulator [Pyrinomonadaceae bacterium]|jgi:two-component system invasion response regulator UvrY